MLYFKRRGSTITQMSGLKDLVHICWCMTISLSRFKMLAHVRHNVSMRCHCATVVFPAFLHRAKYVACNSLKQVCYLSIESKIMMFKCLSSCFLSLHAHLHTFICCPHTLLELPYNNYQTLSYT